MPRIRMPRVTRPGRASRAASERTTTTKPAQAAEHGNGAERGGHQGDGGQEAAADG